MPKTDRFRALYVLNYLWENTDEENFLITEPVTVCSTFYSWVFNYGGKIKIVAPEDVKQDSDALIHKFCKYEYIISPDFSPLGVSSVA